MTSTAPITRTIGQLPPATVPLAGNELLETVQTGSSAKVTTRAFVLPTDPLLTFASMSGYLPGSRQLVAGANVTLTVGPTTLTISATGGGGGGGTNDHSLLINLDHDDHPQYFDQTRGDARYYTKALADSTFLTPSQAAATYLTPAAADALFLTPAEGNALYAPAGSVITDHGLLTGLGDDDHPQYFNQARGDARYALAGSGGAASSFVFVSSGDPALVPANGIVANSCWVDTTLGTGNWVLKVRNATNTAWEPVRGFSSQVNFAMVSFDDINDVLEQPGESMFFPNPWAQVDYV